MKVLDEFNDVQLPSDTDKLTTTHRLIAANAEMLPDPSCNSEVRETLFGYRLS